MDDNRLPRQAVHKQLKEKAWKTTKELDRDTIQQDLKSIGMTWEVAQQLLSTEKAVVDVWPNVSLTRDELRSKVR